MKKLFVLLLGLFMVVGLAQVRPTTDYPPRHCKDFLKVAPTKADSGATTVAQLTRPAVVS